MNITEFIKFSEFLLNPKVLQLLDVSGRKYQLVHIKHTNPQPIISFSVKSENAPRGRNEITSVAALLLDIFKIHFFSKGHLGKTLLHITGS